MSEELTEQIDSHEPDQTESSEDIGTDDQDAGQGEESSEETGGQSLSEGGEGDTPPAYQPNLQYKVYDDVREFPEWSHKLISDEETEKHLRDLFTKAEGIEAIKERYGSTKDELDQVRSEHQKYQDFLRQSQHFSSNDLKTFFDMHQIPKDKVLDFARQLLRAEQDPQEAAALDARSRQIREQYNADNRVTALENHLKEERTQRFNSEMSMALSQPHISEFEQKFNALKGPGAFRQAIADYGSAQYARGRQAPPHESVNYVYNLFRDFVGQGTGASASPQSSAPRERPKTIPNLGPGRGHSAAKARPKTIEEMKKQFREMGVYG
jgi:hypothetical protein